MALDFNSYLSYTGQPNYGSSSGGSMASSFNPFYALLGSMGGGALGGLFGSSGYTNPADAAMPYVQEIPGTITPYYQPYIDTGLGAMDQFYGNAQQLASPQGASDIYKQMGAGYTASPGYQYNVDQATQAAEQAGAASGMAGSPSEQAALANEVSGMAAQDYDTYMNQVLGLYGMGNEDLGMLTKQGYGASTGLADALAKNLMAQAGIAYGGTAMQDMQGAGTSQMLSSLGSLAGMALGFL